MPIPSRELPGWSRLLEEVRLICESIATGESHESLYYEDDRFVLERARDAESPRLEVRLADRDRTLVCRVDDHNHVHTLRVGRWMAFVHALAERVRTERDRRVRDERRTETRDTVAFRPVADSELFARFELSLPDVRFEKSVLAEPVLPFDPADDADYPGDDDVDWGEMDAFASSAFELESS